MRIRALSYPCGSDTPLDDFKSANGFTGPRMIAFKATQKLFEELASANYDLFVGSEKEPVVIAH